MRKRSTIHRLTVTPGRASWQLGSCPCGWRRGDADEDEVRRLFAEHQARVRPPKKQRRARRNKLGRFPVQ